MKVHDLDTPALTVDLDVLEGNLRDVQAACDALEIGLRAHTKTHKCPAIARLQVAGGALGIACQKLGEAEAMVDAGLQDILIPYNIVGPLKVRRLTDLIRRGICRLTVAADSRATVEGLAAGALEAGCTVRIVVELDTGGGRCGVQCPADALALAQTIDQLPGLEFAGVMTYPASERARPFLEEVRHLVATAGLPMELISGGGTGSQEISKALGCTETRIGSYAYEGMTRVGRREDLHPGRCPLRMVVTVVSTAVRGQIVVDAGQKTFTSYPPTPYGYCLEHPEISIKGMSVEHGHVDVSTSSHRFEVGERLSFIPQHGGMTTNLHDWLYPVRGEEVAERWPVAGRGRAQ